MFKLESKYTPSGDQPQAIKELVEGINEGKRDQVLLGATGTGKSSSAKTLWGKDEASVDRYCNKAQNIAWSGITCAYKAATNEEYFSDLYFKH